METQETTATVELKRLLINQKSVFNVDDLSTYTGLSKSAIYKLTRANKLRFSRPNGKLIFFLKSDVDAFLMSKPIDSMDDVNQEVIDYTRKTVSKGGARW
jgi:prophage regulatory protein